VDHDNTLQVAGLKASTEYDATLVLSASVFMECMKKLGGCGGRELLVECQDENVRLVSGGDNTRLTLDILNRDLEDYEAVEGETVTAVYALGIISGQFLSAAISDLVTVNITQNGLMNVTYEVHGDEEPELCVEFYLPPVVSDQHVEA
jgi:hypothetical protein